MLTHDSGSKLSGCQDAMRFSEQKPWINSNFLIYPKINKTLVSDLQIVNDELFQIAKVSEKLQDYLVADKGEKLSVVRFGLSKRKNLNSAC